MMLSRILYVHEEPGATWALERALDFARRVDGRLTLAACAGEASSDLLGAAGLEVSRLEGIATEELRDELERMRAAYGSDGASLPIEILRGRPFVAIIREVLEKRHDLVVVAAPGPAGVAERLFFPSTAMHLVRKSPVPVWVMRPSSTSLRRIGVAVDAEEKGARLDLDRALVEAAATVARAYEAGLDVFHALFLHPSPRMLRNRAGLDEPAIAAIVTRARNRIGRALEELARHAGWPAATHVLEGRPAVEIRRFATHADLDLLVMGSVGRGGIGGLLIGNTAEDVLQQVECSLLTLKPAGFATPVA